MGLSEKQEIEDLRGVTIEPMREHAGSDFAEECTIYGCTDFLEKRDSNDVPSFLREPLEATVYHLWRDYFELQDDKDLHTKMIYKKNQKTGHWKHDTAKVFFADGEFCLSYDFDFDNVLQNTYQAISDFLNR